MAEQQEIFINCELINEFKDKLNNGQGNMVVPSLMITDNYSTIAFNSEMKALFNSQSVIYGKCKERTLIESQNLEKISNIFAETEKKIADESGNGNVGESNE